MRRTALLVFLALTLGLNVTPSSAAKAQESSTTTVTLQLKWFHQFQFAGYYAAIEKGYYRDANLQVILKEGQPGLNITEELTSGRADYLVSNPGGLLARAEGKSIVALAAIFQHTPLVIISRKESQILTPTGLAGKRFMFIPETEAELSAIFVNEGVKLDRINILPHSWDLSDLISGNVDAMSAYLTDAPFILDNKGVKYDLIKPITYGIDFYGDVLFTTGDEIDNNPQRVEAFRHASLRGWAYAMEHTEEIIDLLLTKYNTRLSRDELRFEAEAMKELILPQLVEIGHMNPGRWQHIADTYIKLDLLPDDFSLKGFLYSPKGGRAWDPHLLWGGVVILVLSGATVLVLLLFNRRLRVAVQKSTEKFRESEERFHKMFQEHNAVMLLVDPTTQKVVDANEAACRYYGYTREEIIYLPITKINAQSIDETEKAMQKVKERRKNHFEFKHTLANGAIRDVEVYSSPISIEGHPLLFSVIHDITERKRAEEKLGNYRENLEALVEEQTHKLKEAHDELLQKERLATLGRVTATVSHELRNPLGTIKTALFSIDESLESHERQKTTRPLQLAERSIDRCVNIIEELNSYTRVKSLNLSETSLDDWLQGIIAEQEIPKEIHCEQNLASGVKVSFDQEKFRQVIVNLMSNAIHALLEHGSKEKLLKVSSCLRKEQYEISISDNGIGMSEKTKRKVFEPLYSTKGFGVGLGMVIVKNIVEQHHGKIMISSRQGKGTMIKLRFPLTPPEGEIRPASTQEHRW